MKKKTGKKKKGNYLTWKKQINNDLRMVDENLNLEEDSIRNLVQDRSKWYDMVERAFGTVPTQGEDACINRV